MPNAGAERSEGGSEVLSGRPSRKLASEIRPAAGGPGGKAQPENFPGTCTLPAARVRPPRQTGNPTWGRGWKRKRPTGPERLRPVCQGEFAVNFGVWSVRNRCTTLALLAHILWSRVFGGHKLALLAPYILCSVYKFSSSRFWRFLAYRLDVDVWPLWQTWWRMRRFKFVVFREQRYGKEVLKCFALIRSLVLVGGRLCVSRLTVKQPASCAAISFSL